MIQKPIVPPPIIFIGCALIMAYLPNPYPFKINVLAVYLIVSISSAIAFFSLWQFYKSKANINPIHLEKSDVFVVNGIYRFSRNPMYLSLAGLLVAWAVYLQSAVSFLGVFLSCHVFHKICDTRVGLSLKPYIGLYFLFSYRKG